MTSIPGASFSYRNWTSSTWVRTWGNEGLERGARASEKANNQFVCSTSLRGKYMSSWRSRTRKERSKGALRGQLALNGCISGSQQPGAW